MARRKVTFVYDPEETHDGTRPDFHLRAWPGVDPLSVTVEDLPDPPRARAYRVVFETPSLLPWPAADALGRMLDAGLRHHLWGGWKVTEVTDA